MNRSRRALLAGAIGALGGFAAQALGRPQSAAAGGTALILGDTSQTTDGAIGKPETVFEAGACLGHPTSWPPAPSLGASIPRP